MLPSCSKSSSAFSVPKRTSSLWRSSGANINPTASRWSYWTRSRAAAFSTPTTWRKPSTLTTSLAVPAKITASNLWTSWPLLASPRASTFQRLPSNAMLVTRRLNATSSGSAASSRLRSRSVRPPGTHKCVQPGGRSDVASASPIASTAPSFLNRAASPASGVDKAWAPKSATCRTPSASLQKVDMRPAGPRAHSHTWTRSAHFETAPSQPPVAVLYSQSSQKPSRNSEAANPPLHPPPTTRTSNDAEGET
mmetsp:Transcript_18660/g.51183  ORF Transcript_18660/g.51183 Transcript_18660/m.51183 type:complete len:251 (-) Transcript_18660:70-822(-)